jgi:hypothetical protein
VECMGHIVNKYGIWVDPKKIETMKEFPHPKTLKSLCGFMGLKRYYHKFVQNYGKIGAPLTTLLQKNAFTWTLVIDKSFHVH